MKSTKYHYIKEDSLKNTRKRKFLKRTSFVFVIVGIGMMVYVLAPILSWQLFYEPLLGEGTIIAPIPQAVSLKQNALGVEKVLASQKDGDLTKASSWFPTGNPDAGVHTDYKLSIPKLGIDRAEVMVGSDDLDRSLIHYGGSSLPGQYGNAVIFGHSVLPQFFNPKNYKTIFSTLHTLKPGDQIKIDYDNVSYTYTVFEMRVVDPDNISVLEQQFDTSYLTVITCTPPGTLWKRLVVKAKIDNL